MALSDAVKRLEEREPLKIKVEGLCHFANLLGTFSKEDQKTLDDLIKRGISSRIIISLLAEEGYKVGVERFNDHRLNRCKCEKKEAK